MLGKTPSENPLEPRRLIYSDETFLQECRSHSIWQNSKTYKRIKGPKDVIFQLGPEDVQPNSDAVPPHVWFETPSRRNKQIQDRIKKNKSIKPKSERYKNGVPIEAFFPQEGYNKVICWDRPYYFEGQQCTVVKTLWEYTLTFPSYDPNHFPSKPGSELAGVGYGLRIYNVFHKKRVANSAWDVLIKKDPNRSRNYGLKLSLTPPSSFNRKTNK